ncbi:hypothetical protein ATKI12_8334 [Kitasatospora sp. Ki12]
MPYAIGAKVKLTRDAQVTSDAAAAGLGLPGPLFLAEGLEGVVTGSAQEAGGMAQEYLAAFDQQVGPGQFTGHTALLIDGLRQQVIRHGAALPGGSARVRYRVRFENGFVLGGVEENWLTGA